ncbi:hypothetical protein RYH80_01955 [Halobaculum sp. MBLA0147]|uniref:hypothetical protein n=1 Tax=Halobaculum sp. MBLA0147 TaxID=3079934 RepID=UPI0035233DDB
MLALDIENFLVEIDEGTLKHVGPKTKAATAKLFDPEEAGARAFGDSQVKVTAADDDGNEVQIALSPAQAVAVAEDLERLREEGTVFE